MRKKVFYLLNLLLVISLAVSCSPAAPAAPAEEAPAEEPAAEEPAAEEPAAEEPLTIAIVHMQEGNPYFEVVGIGAIEAAEELGIELIFTAPASMDAAGQVEIVDSLIAQGVDAIGIAAIDPNAVVPVGQKAMDAGIAFYSWDSPVAVEGRQVHSDAASPEQLGRIQVQLLGEALDYEGQVAFLSSASVNANSNLWIQYSNEELAEDKYSGMEVVDTLYGDDDYQLSYNLAQSAYKQYPDLKGFISPTSVGIVAASKFVKDEGLTGEVLVAGLGLPSEMKEYIVDGECIGMALWSPIDQGYLAVYLGKVLAEGTITPGDGETFTAGRMGEKAVVDTGDGNLIVYQGDPMVFDQDNIEEWADIF